jgi:predicted ABC-type sugar transport system permease subunit
MIRTTIIWVLGILGGALGGLLVATLLVPPYARDWGGWGAAIGIFIFVCLRLWLGGTRSRVAN